MALVAGMFVACVESIDLRSASDPEVDARIVEPPRDAAAPTNDAAGADDTQGDDRGPGGEGSDASVGQDAPRVFEDAMVADVPDPADSAAGKGDRPAPACEQAGFTCVDPLTFTGTCTSQPVLGCPDGLDCCEVNN